MVEVPPAAARGEGKVQLVALAYPARPSRLATEQGCGVALSLICAISSCKESGKLKQGEGQYFVSGGLVSGDQRGRRARGAGQGQKDLEGSTCEMGELDRDDGASLSDEQQNRKRGRM